ncbi:MAG TPA: hypothetical protein ENK44_08820 [Caldithrix abyssi]|uniref:Porin n=1 Tax=Caldithrix abyssi TaxID=187145 RepID=A0A7V4WV31_CALAY|nr:hypothetical protein [Caldithrix abyssi]
MARHRIMILTMLAFSGMLFSQNAEKTASVDTAGIAVIMKEYTGSAAESDTIVAQDVHPQDSPADRGFLIISADQKAELRIRGSIRVNGAYDFNGLQNQNFFSTVDIPVGDANKTEPRFFMGVNQTRMGIEAKRATPIGDVFIRVEMDFLGVGGNALRLRHAYGQTEVFLAGQTWTTFSDVSSFPLTVELLGPNSAIIERTVQFRYFRDASEDFRWSVAVESPRPDIGKPDTLQIEPAFQSFPDIAGRLRKYGDWGHVQLAAILRSIVIKSVNNERDGLIGYGGLLTGKINFTERNILLYQAVYGKAISGFIKALSGKGLDVVYNPTTREFETVASVGGYVSYRRIWRPHLSSYFTAGLVKVVNKDFQPGDAFSLSRYISVDLFWEASPGVRLGVEYSWGQRVNKNDESGTANRLSSIVYYDF